ncbi:FdtA/QdtA family cupin domain-containing protein [Fulvivirgaceae bacterium BMA10]|uniref:FdtA/QdtA family cupin domain-containing protein n=1 Tax=Splendidivirga corallicola TaxID=3051826 RepID=A0ABT8KRK2_9BACT|nr:FdtA/QdtA family cupin domain-containing protein [Fulvivirgaceae bacterium BMA10]
MLEPKIIHFQNIIDPNGNITIANFTDVNFPFAVKRIYWLDDVPKGKVRGEHAQRKNLKILICLKGSVEIELEDLQGKKSTFSLKSSKEGLFIPNLYWSRIKFGEGAILICLASQIYEEQDYIRSHEAFLAINK